MPVDDLWCRDLTTAKEFLAALDPNAPEWRSLDWAFRGQGDADWDLIPKVLRRTTKDGPPVWETDAIEKESGLKKTPESLPARRLLGEKRFVLQFRYLADRAGLAIPEDSARLRSWRMFESIAGASPAGAFATGTSIIPPEGWPPPELLSLVALAQHSGVPTRLLDWSWKARVAAYFAARDVMDYDRTGVIAVWALNVKHTELMFAHEKIPPIEIIQAPQATNANLAAQAGLFTLMRAVHEDAGVNTVLANSVKEKTGPIPLKHVLRKFTLPATEARALMARLAYEHVTAATVFPGYVGVVEAMDEGEWWDGASDDSA